MISPEFVAALRLARSKMAGNAWQQVIATASHWDGRPTPDAIRQSTDGILNRDAAWILAESFKRDTHATWHEIVSAMTAVDFLVGDTSPMTEIIWTGPANDRFPIRRIDQVLYDLISKAQRQILLVTFAAHRIPHLCLHLCRASERGVELTLIVESEGESEGQLTRDAAAAFQSIPPTNRRLFYWPLQHRERNQAGRPGKLHSKCAIIDDVALIGSANLTDDAFTRNMELGVLIRERTSVCAMLEHFNELVGRGILVQIQN